MQLVNEANGPAPEIPRGLGAHLANVLGHGLVHDQVRDHAIVGVAVGEHAPDQCEILGHDRGVREILIGFEPDAKDDLQARCLHHLEFGFR
ncbi:MAG: hypothetical protein IPN59_16635 [Holophaga sp.]|nr:hypothetical protein [Holophaga sp.]